MLRCEAVNQSKGAHMARANDEHTNSTEATSDTHAKEREPGRLTPMPDCLMHWWIPFGLAGLLLIICTLTAFLWGGHVHWPSANGITVCLTIAGAALAFSSWQQRIEDNAKEEDKRTQEQRELEAQREEREQKRIEALRQYETEREERERNRLEQIERDEYWKRREHILRTLDSNNPGIRLAAISLLAELADSAAHSTLLNPTAQRQLQQYIISTLCLQLRHEGQLLESEGTKEDHIGIQSKILEVIFTRVDPADKIDLLANWSTEALNFRNVNFYTEFKMIDRKTKCTIELTGAVFHENATFSECTINKLVWHRSSFMKQLEVHSQRKNNTPGTIISHDNFPEYISYGDFKGIAFCKEGSAEGLDHKINIRTSNESNSPNYNDINYLSFSECTFLHPISTLREASNSPVAYRRTEGNAALDETQLPENYTWGILRIEQRNYDSTQSPERDTGLKFDRCAFEKVCIDSGLTHSNTEFTSCYFASQAIISIRTANKSKSYVNEDHIIFDRCIFAISSDVAPPIKLSHIIHGKSGYIPRTFLRLQENQAQTYADNSLPIFQPFELTDDNIGERQLRIMRHAELLSFEEIVAHS